MLVGVLVATLAALAAVWLRVVPAVLADWEALTPFETPIAWLVVGIALLVWIVNGELDKELYILGGGIAAFGPTMVEMFETLPPASMFSVPLPSKPTVRSLLLFQVDPLPVTVAVPDEPKSLPK